MKFGRALLLIAALIGMVMPICMAQATSRPSPPPASQRGQVVTPANNPPGQELAKESNEAVPRKDENAQFRESPSVKWLAKKLHLSLPATYWIFVALNFLVIAYLAWQAFFRAGISFMQMPAIPPAARARRAEIRKQMEESRQASDDAGRRLREIEARLGRLDAEIAQLQANAAEQGNQEEARLKAATEDEKQRLLDSAAQEIAAASASARRDLRVYAASLAVELAEKKIRIDAAADQALVRDFTDQLGRNGQ